MQTISFQANKIFFLFFFLFVCFFVKAQTTSERGAVVISKKAEDTLTGNVYAIIMGVSNYPGINPLKYADKDAILFSDFLKTPGGGNARPENIKLLINDSATMNDFNVKAYGWLLSKNLKKGDRLYLYFSGHGDAMNEDLYFFLPYDCMPNKDQHNYLGTGNINMYNVKTLFIKPQVLKGVDVLLIMDACRTNELPGGADGQKNFVNNFMAEKKMGDIMLLSTGAGQVSIESPAIGNGHGLFTYYLVDGLAGAADRDSLIGDNDGKVSLAEISSYIRTRVTRRARMDFKTVQIPFSCCDEKNLATITKVDAPTYTAWEKNKELQQMSTGENLFAVNTAKHGEKGPGDLSNIDTSLINIYNRFADALKKERLAGESSAETFYKEMEKKWPGNNLTEDAKYSLAAEYLNFCQQKINLFLGGKGLVHIVFMEKELNRDQKENDETDFKEMGEQIKKLKTLVTTGFDVADTLMDKATIMLKDEPELLKPLLPKRYFLKTMAAYASKNRKLNEVVQYCRIAIASDTLSAAGYQLMGWIYQDMENDSCEYYFKKAADIAPKWPYPMNGLGNYYVAKNDKKKAMQYFFKTLQMDSLCSNAYRNLGMTYYNKRLFDSAKIYFMKSLALDSCDSYANENWAGFNSAYILPDFGSSPTDTIYFKISRKFLLKSIECDSSFASGYQKISALYSRAKKEDSALAILQKCVAVNPRNAEAFRNLGKYYLNNGRDTVQAEINFKKAISLDSSGYDNYNELATLYRKQKDKDKAIGIYKEALGKLGKKKDLFNELGNTYFEAPSAFDTAITWYKKALEIDSTLDYVYFNLGKLYDIKDIAKDSSIYYYSRAVFYDPDRFDKVNYTIDKYYNDNKNYDRAKIFYRQVLDIGTAKKFWLNRYLGRLVQILIKENNFAEAENALKQYLNPASDKDLYTKLSKAIDEGRINAAQK